ARRRTDSCENAMHFLRAIQLIAGHCTARGRVTLGACMRLTQYQFRTGVQNTVLHVFAEDVTTVPATPAGRFRKRAVPSGVVLAFAATGQRPPVSSEASMKSWGLIVGSLFLTLGWPHSGSAQDWPTRTVTVVVPLPAGTSVDSIARLVMQQVAKQVGQ